MPRKPQRPCKYPGCPHLTDHKTGYCDTHLRQTRQQYDRERGTSTERGYDARWRRYRKSYLAKHPLCEYCLDKTPPIITPAKVVDHIIPHRGDYDLFWDENNWKSSCKECHDIKTAREDGAFGNPTASRGLPSEEET